ncbi:unnamed protein product (macronuclear) [Paramecium tetraurelia]|uniref:Uncharacterized protein n=1 Tax=Paramecium tetraurelia TaxID=5888 RepID=A0E1H8_PARTE|nr:uncharacterized protein GSPATT00022314001 [Paramecium tetraurelia]CAK89145.1 unnamed protein product [Paramecium tetraurelia]|eukprot:XP_001456542.1 hypothetical protein (macronuclear) [Paramecium tetraurelia strain d4-2]
MRSESESDSEHFEFVQSFFHLIQDINNYCHNKAQRNRTAKFMKNAKARRKIGQINFRMPQSADQNVSEIVSFNKNQAEKLVKPMRNQTKNLENSKVETFICNVHQILRDIQLKQQILRNVQKQVYLNLIQYDKKQPSQLQQKTSCLHVYLAEKIYADQIKDSANYQIIHETPKIAIPLFKNIPQTRKGSKD